MNKKSVLMTGRPARTLALVVMATVSLSACTNQKVQQQTQAELGAAQTCIARQEAQGQQFSEQQAEILRQVQQVQQQMAAQQQAVEAKLQVI